MRTFELCVSSKLSTQAYADKTLNKSEKGSSKHQPGLHIVANSQKSASLGSWKISTGLGGRKETI